MKAKTKFDWCMSFEIFFKRVAQIKFQKVISEFFDKTL